MITSCVPFIASLSRPHAQHLTEVLSAPQATASATRPQVRGVLAGCTAPGQASCLPLKHLAACMTALSVQHALQGHSPEMVVDGRTLSRILGPDSEALLAELANMCSGVVVCRASPSQKATIVRMMKRLQVAQLSGTVSAWLARCTSCLSHLNHVANIMACVRLCTY